MDRSVRNERQLPAQRKRVPCAVNGVHLSQELVAVGDKVFAAKVRSLSGAQLACAAIYHCNALLQQRQIEAGEHLQGKL